MTVLFKLLFNFAFAFFSAAHGRIYPRLKLKTSCVSLARSLAEKVVRLANTGQVEIAVRRNVR